MCEHSNQLAYFLCAVHRQAAPQPQKKKGRHTSIASNSSSGSEASSCTSAVLGKNCQLPELRIECALPLGYWDSLYYALVVEIRRLHSDLQDKYGWGIEHGIEPLHHFGADGTKKGPVTPIELASMLETAWYDLMDTRLVASLDDAVRMRKIQANAEKKRASSSTKSSCDGEEAYERPPIIQGLIDINGMGLEDITGMLWEKHAPEVDQAAAEDFEDPSMFTAYRAELDAQDMDQARLLEAEPPSSKCNCRGKCICQLRCNVHTSYCTCRPVNHTYYKLTSPTTSTGEAEATFISSEMVQKKKLGTGQGTEAIRQMTMGLNFYASSYKAALLPHHAIVEKIAEKPQERKIASRYRNRQRADTNISELAYVPDGKGSRGKSSRGKGRDAYPLGFYIDSSPGRYPKMRKGSSSSANEGYAGPASTTTTGVPARKPVPAPLLPSQPYVAPDASYGVVTPPGDNRYAPAAFVAARAQAAYHENARLATIMTQNHQAVAQSFPVTGDNPRHAVNSDPFVDSASPTAEDYTGLLARHPSSFDTVEDPAEPFPSFTRSATTTPPRPTKATKASASTTNLPTFKALSGDKSKPMPPLPALPDLPEPEFIRPRPAQVQRYVSAGGNLPLSQRTEIQGPAFRSTGFNTPAAVNVTSGSGMSKDEVDAKLSDPEWVKAHFGAAAIESVSLTPPKKVRGSADSTATSAAVSSGRSSRETTSNRASVEQQQGGSQIYNPRDRTSSGVSSTKAKFKRVFSRKNSGMEDD